MIESTSQKLQKAGGAEREAREWLKGQKIVARCLCSDCRPNLAADLGKLLEKCANEARLEEARWWRAQIDSRLHGAFYKTNDPTAARRIEDERIAELEAKK